jgi:integrase/recombinase XerD
LKTPPSGRQLASRGGTPTILIQQGNGKKDRMIPIGERAIMWVSKYLDTVQPDLAVPPDDGTIFLTNMGEPLSPNRLTQIAREYVAGAVNKTGACHIFRHTMATLMLEGGADIRFIQEMLGHVELSTTQIYTRVSIRKLKQVHDATHPSAKIEPRHRARQEAVANREHAHDVSDLLDALGAEADEEDEPDGLVAVETGPG